MNAVLLALVSSISGLSGVAIGAAWMRRIKPASDCPNHIWSQWEDAQIPERWTWNDKGTKKVPVLIDGQKRVCAVCGEKEHRRVDL